MTNDPIRHFLARRGRPIRVATRLAFTFVAAFAVFACRVAAPPQPDTITLVVRASLSLAADTIVYRDSTLVLVEFVPVGAVPPRATATLTLMLP